MNENYKGSIELISGLKQKNNLDFPLMEANAVAVYEDDGTEIRLDNKLKKLKEELTVSEQEKKEIIGAAVDAVFDDIDYKSLTKAVENNSTAIFGADTGLNSRVSALETQVEEGDNKELKIQFEEKESMLYLYAGDTLIKPNPDDESIVSNVISQTTVSGGGAGASLNYKLTLRILDNSSNLTFLHTDTPKIKYIADFIDTSVEEGENNLVPQTLNFKLTITLPSGAKNTYSFTGASNTELEYDLTQVLSTSTGLILGDHNITLTVSYTQEIGDEATPVTIQSTKKWAVKITEMYLNSNFDDSSVKIGNVPFTVTVYGDLNKTIHYNFNGQEDWMKTENASLSNYDYTISIPKQSHGNYPLEVYLTADVNGTIIRSNSLFYDIMFMEEGNEEPIIRAVPASYKGQQYSNLAINYSVYTPNKLLSEVELAVDGNIISTLDTVDRAKQTWNYKPMTEGTKTLTISSGSTTRTLIVEIEKFPYTIEGVTAGLELDFLPQGRTNQDADYNIFKNNVFDKDGNEVPIEWTLSENFDWINGGWKVDENEDSYFCVKAGTSVNINYLLFNDANTLVGTNKSKGNGKEFKIIFKTTNVARTDTTWLSCLANPESGSELGIQMDAHAAYIKTSAGTELSVPYSEEDKIEFDMNIVPISYKDGMVDLTTQDIPMIITYEDGTPVRPLVLNDDKITFKQQNAVPITIGSPYCDIHIYRIKAYSTYLSEKNILNNFIADASNAEEMINRYTRNQIYDKTTGKLTPESFAAACPDMRVIKVSAPRFTNDKKDKVLETTVEMIYKNGDPVLDNWKAVYARHNGQGTSSNAYGYAGRNLELSLKEKETLRYKITKPEGVYNEDGELLVFGTVIEGKQDFFLDEALENKVEDASTVATVTTIPGTTITLGDGVTTTKKVSLTRDSVPTNYFNIKVNIASSEQANNALLQKRYDRYLPYTSYAAANDEKVKNTMNFYNCVIFVQERNEDLTTHQEFNDNEWHFYSMGNIGDSKKTDDSRANDPDDTTEFCVEIMDWNRELSAFPQDTKVQTSADKYLKKDKSGTITDYIFATEKNLQAGLLFEKDYNLTQYQEQNSEGIWVSYGYKVSTDETLETGWIVTNKQGIYNDSGEHFTPGNIYEEKTLNQKFYTSADVEIREEVIVSANTALRVGKYYIDILEQDDYSEDYTYGFRYLNDDESEEQIATAKAKWNEFYRFITRDNYYDDRRADEAGQWLEDPDKIAAWKSEFENWFIKDAAFYYYLFTLRYTMVDNRAKNSFWHWGKCLDGKYRMDFWDYDNDTALGIDNTGKFTMSYGVEDHDVNEGGAAHFRAHNSTFFVRVADYFAEELITYYSTLEKDPTVFSSTSLINEFDAWQSEFPEEVWRKQYERIYKRTYVGGYGPTWDNAVNPAQIKKAADPDFLVKMMNGKKKYQRRQFERNQDIYMSSKFFGVANSQDMITLRGGGPMNPNDYIVKPNGDVTITPYLNMYVNAGPENNGFLHHVKANAGESVTLKYPTKDLEFNYIYGGSYMQSLGDLSAMYLGVAKLGAGRRLKQLILGNHIEGYDNPNLVAAEFNLTADNKLLEELDITNMSGLVGTIPIKNIPSLRKLYAQGTKYSIVDFPNNGLIEEAYLPDTIERIYAINLYYMNILKLDAYDKLEYLLLDNCSKLKELDSETLEPQDLTLVKKASNLKRVKITNIDWNLNTADVLNKLVKCQGFGEDNITEIKQSVLTGKVYIENIRQTEIDAFSAAWPELKITYGYLVPQNIVSFYNYDGALLGSIHIDQGEYCIDPIVNGLFTIPIKESTAQYDFTFAGWASQNTTDIVDITQEKISTNRNFVAQYSKTLRKYTVTWYGESATNPMFSTTVNYGEEAIFNEIPTKTPYNTLYYLFNGWDVSTAYITGDTEVHAIWAQANGADIYEAVRGDNAYRETETLSAIEIYALNQYKGSKNSFQNGDVIELQLGYMPTYSEDETKERVLAENLVLTGQNYKVFNDIELFNEDKDFVIALDFTSEYRTSGGEGSFLSCYQGNPTRGIRTYNTPGENTSALFKFGLSTDTIDINPSKHVLSEENPSYREICVIRHKKGSETLELYRNNRYSTSEVVKEVFSDPGNLNYTKWEEGSHPLVLGADYDRGNFSNKAVGTIHYAKIWFNDIGEDDCKKICSWIYEKMYFDYVGANRYYYADSSTKCSASFISQNLLDEAYKLYENSYSVQPGGWANTQLRTWMNSKLFNGLSITWKQILREVVIKSIQNTEAGTANAALRKEVTQSNNFFYLPSIAEVTTNLSQSDIFSNELTSTLDGAYPIFGGADENNSRIKTKNGIPSIWWLRSPYYTATATTSTLNYYNAVRANGEVSNRLGWNEVTDTGSSYVSCYGYYLYGICPCFSI